MEKQVYTGYLSSMTFTYGNRNDHIEVIDMLTRNSN